MRRKLLLWVTVLFMPGGGFAADPVQGTLCRPDEQVLFSCPLKTGNKIASLCGSAKLTPSAGYLQYRVGKPGKIELEFPSQRQASQQQFRYVQYARYQVEHIAIRFDNNQYRYTIFDHYEGDSQPKVRQQGIEIIPPGNKPKVTTLLCRGAASGNLQPLTTVVPCDKDDPLNMGECP